MLPVKVVQPLRASASDWLLMVTSFCLQAGFVGAVLRYNQYIVFDRRQKILPLSKRLDRKLTSGDHAEDREGRHKVVGEHCEGRILKEVSVAWSIDCKIVFCG